MSLDDILTKVAVAEKKNLDIPDIPDNLDIPYWPQFQPASVAAV